MGIDNRGYNRKQCLAKDCDCEEYEVPTNTEYSYNCVYCLCPPAKHKREDSSPIPAASLSQQVQDHSSAQTLRTSDTAQPTQKWKDKKYGYVEDAKRKISMFGNELLPTFFSSYKERAGSDPALMKKMFIAERDRQYFIMQEIKTCQSRLEYLISDNPACAGRFLCEKYSPKPHDNSNIERLQNEVDKLKKKVENIKHKISTHDDSLFSSRTGKIQTGLSCHHKFNEDTKYDITTGIQKNVLQLSEELDRALKKYKSTHFIGSKSRSTEARRKKQDKRKANKRKLEATENRKKRACVIFMSLGGNPVDGEYDPDRHGVAQIDDIDQETMQETLSLFTSLTDQACLRDLLRCHCLVGEAALAVQEVLS